MPLFFQSLLSGSAGNMLTVWTPRTRLLIDAGPKSQRHCRETLDALEGPRVDALFASHLHQDHLNYASLRVMETIGADVYVHADNRQKVVVKHKTRKRLRDLSLKTFQCEPLVVGDLRVTPFPVEHDGHAVTCGFCVETARGRSGERVVVATDLCRWRGLERRFEDAGLIYLESNYDPALLRQNPNYASQFHLSNPHAGQLLAAALGRCERRPSAVLLGHLSDDRNTPELALETVRGVLDWHDVPLPPRLEVAPRAEPSKVYRVGFVEEPGSVTTAAATTSVPARERPVVSTQSRAPRVQPQAIQLELF